MAVVNGKQIKFIKNELQAQAVTLEDGKGSERIRAGKGLYLRLRCSAKGVISKTWNHPYKYEGKSKELQLGTFNQESKKHTSIAKARVELAKAIVIQSDGLDPAKVKRQQKLYNQREQLLAIQQAQEVEQAQKDNENTFEMIARQWHTSTLPKRSPKDAVQIMRRLEKEIFPTLGSTPLKDLIRADVMELLVSIYHSKKANGTERNDLARRIALNVRSAFDYAVDLGLIEFTPMGKINKLMPPPIHKHYPAIKDSNELGELLRDIDAYKGTYLICMALKILRLVVFRNTEFRSAEWEHIDFECMEWVIPSANRKQKTPQKAIKENFHIVPLPKQALTLLKELQVVTGSCKYVFDKPSNKEGFISENAINPALHKMGYKGRHCGHGWRTTFSSIQKDLGMDRDLVETQLSHVIEGGDVRRAYLQNDFLKHRRVIVQKWADYLDGLRNGANAIPIHRKA